MYHQPVLLHETIEELVTNPDGIYVDATYGGGGHARAILKKLSENGRLLGFDQDIEVVGNCIQDPRFQFIHSNFKHLKKFLQYHHAYPVDGIMGDLGVSSHQFDQPARGFSYRFDSVLDMRMDPSKETITAEEIVNTYPQQKLAKLFHSFGELQYAHKIATLIEKSRQYHPIRTTGALAKAVQPALIKNKENKLMSQIFQALRIEVNGEIDALKSLLIQSVEALKPGGRIAIISYHSLEDRMVKNLFKTGNIEGVVQTDFFGNPITPLKRINKKTIVASPYEIEQNPRARSAKLRIAEKI